MMAKEQWSEVEVEVRGSNGTVARRAVPGIIVGPIAVTRVLHPYQDGRIERGDALLFDRGYTLTHVSTGQSMTLPSWIRGSRRRTIAFATELLNELGADWFGPMGANGRPNADDRARYRAATDIAEDRVSTA